MIPDTNLETPIDAQAFIQGQAKYQYFKAVTRTIGKPDSKFYIGSEGFRIRLSNLYGSL